jgi:hypothetical protein
VAAKWLRPVDTSPIGRVRRLLGLGHRGHRPDWRPSDEWFARIEASRTVAPSPLRGVVAVGQSADVSGLVVELIAIEVRERGAILYLRARAEVDRMLVGAEASVSDQFGTAYSVVSGVSGGGNRSWAGEVVLVPTPPAGSRLRVVVAYFGPTPDRPLPPHVAVERLDGPWAFEVQIPSDKLLSRQAPRNES